MTYSKSRRIGNDQATLGRILIHQNPQLSTLGRPRILLTRRARKMTGRRNLVTRLGASLPRTSLETKPQGAGGVGNRLTSRLKTGATTARHGALRVPNAELETILHRFAAAIPRLAKAILQGPASATKKKVTKAATKAATLSSANASRSAEKSLPRSLTIATPSP